MLASLRDLRPFTSLAALAVALLATEVADAQSAPAASAAPAAPAPDEANPTADIVVTAQRRTERLQDVPIAISALGDEQLAQRNIVDLSNLTGVVPGLQIAGFGGANTSNTVAIRGVSGQQLAIGAGQATAIYLDGVYLSRPDEAFFGLDDVERIEVLRGPQGTLYGRNATAGAINIITRDPGNTLQGGGEVSYGNYNTVLARASLSGPIGGGLSAGLSGSYDRHDGYIRNTVTGDHLNDRDTYTLRGKLRYATADDRFSAVLAGDYTHDLATPAFKDGVDPATGATIGIGDPDVLTGDALSESLTIRRTTSEGVSLSLNFKASDTLDLVSITSARDATILSTYDGDTTVAQAVLVSGLNKSRTFNQEVRGVYTGSALRATLGANVFTEKASFGLSTLNPTLAPVRANPFDKSDLTAWALFGQLEYDLARRLTLVGGLRYNNESRDYSVDYTGAPKPGVLIAGTVKGRVVLPSVGLNFKATPDLLFYAKVSEGYQAPGFTYSPGAASASDITFGAEKLWAYEVGAKTQFLDHRVTLNTAAFLYKYSDLQIRSTIAVGLSRVSNAASATIKGVEASLHVVLPAGFDFDAQATYLDARYGSFCQPISGGDPQAGDPLCGPGLADRSGNRLNLAPEWSGGVALGYKHSVGTAGTLSASVNLDLSGTAYYLSAANEPALRTGAWNKLNARVGFRFHKGPEVFVYADNLTNDRYLTSVQRGSPTLIVETINDPRTYGVGIGYRF